MTRTGLYKAHYFGTMAVVGGLAWTALVHYGFSATSVVVTVALCLTPGRVLGHFWRDLLRGLRLLGAHRYEESRQGSKAFLAMLERRPWIRHLVWLGSSAYSHDPRVLALNNLGAAEVGLGDVASARRNLLEAIRLDGRCPLPFHNLGVLHQAEGDIDEAERCFARALELGYRGRIDDAIVRSSQSRLAATEGAVKS